MSSVTVPFILARMMDGPGRARRGVALGFGPGLSVESLAFTEAA
jgi:predicted naringenin-chalcone synthase